MKIKKRDPRKISLDRIKEMVKEMNPYMDILNESQPEQRDKDLYICHCNLCGGTFYKTHRYIVTVYSNKRKDNFSSKWCPVCSNRICITGINDLATIRPDLVKYFVNTEDAKIYTIYSSYRDKFKCPDCGYEKTLSINDFVRRGFSCQNCSDTISYPNKICRSLLKQLPVDEYILEYYDKWTQGKRYDAYFLYKGIKYLLEFDGIQHFTDCTWSTFENQKKNDSFKNQLAVSNGYHLIRINASESSFEYIKEEILKSELSNIFNLSKIQWDICEQESLENIILNISKYYNEHSYIGANEIADIFHLGKATALRYLHKGTKAGLCNFDPNASKEYTARKSLQTKAQSYYDRFYLISPNDVIISEFGLISDCVEYIKNNILDLQLTRNQIKRALLSGNPIQGYRLEYVNGLEKHYKNNVKMREVCAFYSNNPQVTIKEISTQFHIKDKTVSLYLSVGAKIGLCDYVTYLDVPDNVNKYAKYCKNSWDIITVYKDNELLGTYYGAAQCSRGLMNLYPNEAPKRQALYSTINRTYKGQNSFDYKGFHFEINHNKEAIAV